MIIQRPQNLYFLLCAVLCAVGAWMSSPFAWGAGQLLMIIAAVISLVTIFLFKQLSLQRTMGTILLIFTTIVFILIIYDLFKLSGEADASEKGIEWWSLLSIALSMVLSFAAIRAVKKDINLVKSADRLR